jgi:hypothetical protein
VGRRRRHISLNKIAALAQIRTCQGGNVRFAMKMVLTAGVLCAALLVAAVGAVHAESAAPPAAPAVITTTAVGE